jgi:tRNA dimethylallyltransferase
MHLTPIILYKSPLFQLVFVTVSPNVMKSLFPPRITVICGPTCVGKTSVAIEVASALGAEIINADSMQIYRYMDIGTAKPSSQEQARILHHMIDIVDPDEPFDAQQYSDMGRKLISQLSEEDIPVVVAGGTGLYIRALLEGLFQAGSGNLKLRMDLNQEAQTRGVDHLYRRLCECDPTSAAKIHPHDTFRLVRALEIFQTTGQPISAWHREHRQTPPLFDVLKIGLYRQREILYERINRRVDLMIEEGLLDEVKSLLNRGYSSELKSLQSIGYRHIIDFIESRLSWDDTLQTLKRDTRRYAKRQLSWFNSDSQIKWIDADRLYEIIDTVKSFVSS